MKSEKLRAGHPHPIVKLKELIKYDNVSAEVKCMKESVLAEKTMDFATDIVTLADELKMNKEFIISSQIGRSGTSIGANVYEADYAASRADFVNKLRIALKEANETLYWLNLLLRTDKIDKDNFDKLNENCNAIRAMLIKSIKTADKK